MEHQPWPSELNAARQGHALELKEKLTVRYAVDARDTTDVGAIQANHPVPSNCTVYYYELTVLDQGRCGRIAIGFADKSFKLNRQPGWEVGSYGYHGDDGKKFTGHGLGEDYGPTFGAGDTVGAGIHLGRQELFFTKNGTKLKVAHRPVRAGLYPTIGLHSKGEMVQINFGQKPFVFDLEGMLAEEKATQRAAVERIPVSPGTTHQLVRQYLLHYGYQDTLRAFDEAAGLAAGGGADGGGGGGSTAPSSAPSSDADSATGLALRASLRRALMSGEVDQALSLLAAHCPAVLSDPAGRFGDVHFQLACQKYIELVRGGNIHEAVVFAQGTLAGMRGPSAADLEASLRDVVALVAYQNPETSPLGHLLSQGQRDVVADAVNAAVLMVMAEEVGPAAATEATAGAAAAGGGCGVSATAGGGCSGAGPTGKVGSEGSGGGGGGAWPLRPALNSGGGLGAGPGAAAVPGSAGAGAAAIGLQVRPASRVESLLRQLEAVQAALHEANGGQGAAFNLQEYILGPAR